MAPVSTAIALHLENTTTFKSNGAAVTVAARSRTCTRLATAAGAATCQSRLARVANDMATGKWLAETCPSACASQKVTAHAATAKAHAESPIGEAPFSSNKAHPQTWTCRGRAKSCERGPSHGE
eukprot:9503978-Pyramimonas_sp.AAC.4